MECHFTIELYSKNFSMSSGIFNTEAVSNG